MGEDYEGTCVELGLEAPLEEGVASAVADAFRFVKAMFKGGEATAEHLGQMMVLDARGLKSAEKRDTFVSQMDELIAQMRGLEKTAPLKNKERQITIKYANEAKAVAKALRFDQ
jgi:hypothetical protein